MDDIQNPADPAAPSLLGVEPGADHTVFFQTPDDRVGTARGPHLPPGQGPVLSVRTIDGIETYAAAGHGHFFTVMESGEGSEATWRVTAPDGWDRTYSARYWLMVQSHPQPPAR